MIKVMDMSLMFCSGGATARRHFLCSAGRHSQLASVSSVPQGDTHCLMASSAPLSGTRRHSPVIPLRPVPFIHASMMRGTVRGGMPCSLLTRTFYHTLLLGRNCYYCGKSRVGKSLYGEAGLLICFDFFYDLSGNLFPGS